MRLWCVYACRRRNGNKILRLYFCRPATKLTAVRANVATSWIQRLRMFISINILLQTPPRIAIIKDNLLTNSCTRPHHSSRSSNSNSSSSRLAISYGLLPARPPTRPWCVNPPHRRQYGAYSRFTARWGISPPRRRAKNARKVVPPDRFGTVSANFCYTSHDTTGWSKNGSVTIHGVEIAFGLLPFLFMNTFISPVDSGWGQLPLRLKA